VRSVWRFADAAVVGSAIVREIERLSGNPDLIDQVGHFTRSLLIRDERTLKSSRRTLCTG